MMELDERMTTAEGPLRRRSWELEEGQPLVLARDPLELGHRLLSFTGLTGVAPEDILVSRLVSIPLPDPDVDVEDTNSLPPGPMARRAALSARAAKASGGVPAETVNPESLWHPLLWLPPRLASRFCWDEPDGTTSVETEEGWALRVALELTLASLYDVPSGTWLDVMAYVGIDLDSQAGLDRVRAWLSGGEDETLDNLDLTPDIEVEDDPEWALASASSMIDDLVRLAHASGSDALSYEIGLLTPETEGLFSAADALYSAASAWFYDLPDDLAPLYAQIKEGGDTLDANMTPQELLDGPISRLRWLTDQIRTATWPFLQEHADRAAGEFPEIVQTIF